MSTNQTVAAEQSLLDKVRSRGNWRVVISPLDFVKDRVPNRDDLDPIVTKNSVPIRGWHFPFLDTANISRGRVGDDWVQQDAEWSGLIEVWRIYQSGLFVDYFPLEDEWRDESMNPDDDPSWKPGKYLYYLPTVFTVTAIFEFAARLSMSPAGGPAMRVEFDVKGLKDRTLFDRNAEIRFSKEYISRKPDWHHCWKGSQLELMTRSRELAALAAQNFFRQFELDIDRRTFSILQESGVRARG